MRNLPAKSSPRCLHLLVLSILRKNDANPIQNLSENRSNSERQNASLKTRCTVWRRMYSIIISIQYGTGVSSQCNTARKRNSRHPYGKEKVKLPLFTDNMILYIKKSFVESTESKQNQLDLARSWDRKSTALPPQKIVLLCMDEDFKHEINNSIHNSIKKNT